MTCVQIFPVQLCRCTRIGCPLSATDDRRPLSPGDFVSRWIAGKGRLLGNCETRACRACKAGPPTRTTTSAAVSRAISASQFQSRLQYKIALSIGGVYGYDYGRLLQKRPHLCHLERDTEERGCGNSITLYRDSGCRQTRLRNSHSSMD